MKNNDNELTFRTLEAEEIECKPTIVANQIEIALHCRAETCTKILNETVGPLGWEKEYTNNNRNCIVRIWDDKKNRMITKEDCGGGPTEIDGLKGQASNGFKRVCALGWGLGIELYSQPSIKIPVTEDNVTCDRLNNMVVTEKYSVAEIEYENRKISKVVIVDSHGNVIYPYAPVSVENLTEPDPARTEVVLTTATEHEAEIADAEADIVDELPDNTDGYNESEAFMNQTLPFSKENPGAVILQEVKRTNTRLGDVLRAMKIDSIDKVDEVDEALVQSVIDKLKTRPTFKKNN